MRYDSKGEKLDLTGYDKGCPAAPGLYYYINIKQESRSRVEVKDQKIRFGSDNNWYALSACPGWYKERLAP